MMEGRGLRVAVGGFVSGRPSPVVYVASRGIRLSTMRRMRWSGHAVGMCRRIWVFISTTRAAILMRRKRSVSNCAPAKLRALRHRGAQAPHQPVSAGMQEQPELVGRRLGAGRAVGRQMRLPGLDVVLGRAAPAVDILVERLGLSTGEVGDDEAGVGALIADLDAGDDALDPAPTGGAVEELLEAPDLACLSPTLRSAPSCRPPGRRHACAGSWWAPGRG